MLCVAILFPLLMSLGMQRVDASHGGVVLGVLPIATALVAVAITHERPRPLFWIASVAGAALVIAFALRQGGGALAAGDLFLFASVAVAAIGYAFSGRLTSQMPGWEVISWVLVIALPLSIPAAALTMPADITHIAVKPWLGLLYVALFSQWIGFFAWNAGLAMGGIARVSQIQLLQPFVTFALAAFFNDETITLQILLFAAAVVVTVAISTRTRATRGAGAIEAGSRAASVGGILIDQLRMFGNQFGSSFFRADGAKQNPCGLQMIHLHAQLDDLAH